MSTDTMATDKQATHKGPIDNPAFVAWVKEREAAGETWATTSPLQEWLIYVNDQLGKGASPALFFGK